MKKILATILVTVTLISCSKDSSSSGTGASSISPPSWIIGTWAYKISNTNTIMQSHTFTSDNYTIYTAGQTIDFKQTISSSSGKMTIEETIETDNNYELTLKNIVSSGITQTTKYNFSKVNSTIITWQQGGTTQYTKQ